MLARPAREAWRAAGAGAGVAAMVLSRRAVVVVVVVALAVAADREVGSYVFYIYVYIISLPRAASVVIMRQLGFIYCLHRVVGTNRFKFYVVSSHCISSRSYRIPGYYYYSGGGGGLGYKNNIAVTPGQAFSVVVGAGGLATTSSTGYGGGGGGGSGAVRIVWGPGRTFPSIQVDQNTLMWLETIV